MDLCFFATLENLSIVANGSTHASEYFNLSHSIRDKKLQGLGTSTHTQMCLSFIEFDGFNFQYLGENLLRCTTHDEKGLVLTTTLFYLIFWFPHKIMNEKLSKFSKGLYFGLLQF